MPLLGLCGWPQTQGVEDNICHNQAGCPQDPGPVTEPGGPCCKILPLLPGRKHQRVLLLLTCPPGTEKWPSEMDATVMSQGEVRRQKSCLINPELPRPIQAPHSQTMNRQPRMLTCSGKPRPEVGKINSRDRKRKGQPGWHVALRLHGPTEPGSPSAALGCGLGLAE